MFSLEEMKKAFYAGFERGFEATEDIYFEAYKDEVWLEYINNPYKVNIHD